MAEQGNVLATYQTAPNVTVYIMDTYLRGVSKEELQRRDQEFRRTVNRLMMPHLLDEKR